MDEQREEELYYVCEACMGSNVLQAIGIIDCPKCDKPFCIHFSSKVDPQYCVDCMSDVSVQTDTVSKVYEHYNEQTDRIVRYSRRAKRIKIEGQDFLFAQRRIKDMSDAELGMAIEYHRAIYQAMGLEAEERKVANLHRNVNVSVIPSTQVTSTTTVKKSVKTSSDKGAAKISALLDSMKAGGMTNEQIAALLKGMAGK